MLELNASQGHVPFILVTCTSLVLITKGSGQAYERTSFDGPLV